MQRGCPLSEEEEKMVMFARRSCLQEHASLFKEIGGACVSVSAMFSHDHIITANGSRLSAQFCLISQRPAKDLSGA